MNKSRPPKQPTNAEMAIARLPIWFWYDSREALGGREAKITFMCHQNNKTVVHHAELRVASDVQRRSLYHEWLLWHELGHFCDCLKRGKNHLLLLLPPRNWASHTAPRLRVLLRRNRRFLREISPNASAAKFVGHFDGKAYSYQQLRQLANFPPHLLQKLEADYARAVKRTNRYRNRIEELFAEAFACAALMPERLVENDPSLYSAIIRVAARMGVKMTVKGEASERAR